MLARGGDPNARDAHTGTSALMAAALRGRARAVEALASAGAEDEARRLDHRTRAACPHRQRCDLGSLAYCV